MAAALGPACGARTIYLDGTDGASVNDNSNPDAMAPGVSVFIEDQHTAMKIALDEERVYWCQQQYWSDATPWVYAPVRSCMKSDCNSTITTFHSVLVDANRAPVHVGSCYLAVGGGNVAWVEYDISGPSIWTCPTAGCTGEPRVVTGNAVTPSSLAVDESHVYWTSTVDTAVYRHPISGAGALETIALNQPLAENIALSGSHVYWTTRGQHDRAIRRVAKQGGEEASTLAKGQVDRRALSVDSEFVYWANFDAAGSIQRCPLSGCTGEPTVLVGNQNLPGALAADGKSLFWTTAIGALDSSPLRAAVLRCPIEGCESAKETLAVQTFEWFALSMAIDETHLYWVAHGNPAPWPGGTFPHASIYRYMK
jgi:hypothetical protein